MTPITARVSDDIARKIDEAAARLERSRVQVVRQASEYYLEDLEDLKLGIERPAKTCEDWSPTFDVRSSRRSTGSPRNRSQDPR